MDHDSILEKATEIAQEAGRMVREVFPRTAIVEVDWKGPVNPVTKIDLDAEKLIVGRIREAFPDHRVLAEEGGGDEWRAPGAPIWMIDPLDGTNNLAHGFPHVGISLAMVDEGVPVAGVVYDPLREETFSARMGGGATLNGDPISVSRVGQLAGAFLATGFPYDRTTAADNNVERLGYFLRRSQGVRRAGAAVLDLSYVACGRLDGFWEIRLSPWDVAAGVLLVREAGGLATDQRGELDCVSGDFVVASNGLIHSEMLRAISQAETG